MHVWLLWCILSSYMVFYEMRTIISSKFKNFSIFKYLQKVVFSISSATSSIFHPEAFSNPNSLGMPPQLQDIGSAGISQSIAPQRLRSKNQGRLWTTMDDYKIRGRSRQDEESTVKRLCVSNTLEQFGVVWDDPGHPRTLSAATKPRSR